MEELEKVELVREKSGASYEKAREALEACDFDVLDALVWLERAAKEDVQASAPAANETAEAAQDAKAAVEPDEVCFDTNPTQDSGTVKAAKSWDAFCEKAKRAADACLRMTFIVERNGEKLATLPMPFVILGILLWGATIWMLILGLFFGFRYRVEGAGAFVPQVNDAMEKVADAAEGVKQKLA